MKSRLYDKGISVQTMPSVKRPIPENVKPYAAKLNAGGAVNKPPLHGSSMANLKPPAFLLNTLSQERFDDMPTMSHKPSTAGFGIQTRHLKQ